MQIKPEATIDVFTYPVTEQGVKLPCMWAVDELLRRTLPGTSKCEPIKELSAFDDLSFRQLCLHSLDNGFEGKSEVKIRFNPFNPNMQSEICMCAHDLPASVPTSDSAPEVIIIDDESVKTQRAKETKEKPEECLITINLNDVEQTTEVTDSEEAKSSSKRKVEIKRPSVTKVSKSESSKLKNRESSTRKDVLYQTIFRYLRKFYQFMFQRFTKVKGAEGEGSNNLRLFAEYMAKSFQENPSVQDLMIHIGSIIYPSNVQQLEQKIFGKQHKYPSNKAMCKAALSILKYREMIQKFNLDKLTDFFEDPIYRKLFHVYATSIQSGKFEMPRVMQKNKQTYLKTLEELLCDK